MNYAGLSIKEYLKELSSEKPIPGGGGTSALVAALGISLVEMVARIAVKHLDAEKQKNLSDIINLLGRLRSTAEQVIDLDPKVYQQVMDAYAKKKSIPDPKQAQDLIESAFKQSFKLQADLASLVTTAKQLLLNVNSYAKGSIQNDLVVASGILDGAFNGAVATARINVVYMKDETEKAQSIKTLKELEEKYSKIKFQS